MRLVFVRHGQTALNTSPYVQGQTDVPLNQIGEQEARDARTEISDRLGPSVDAVYSSDLQRSVQTAELVFPEHTVRQDPRFREQDFGVVTGSTFEEFFEEYPDFLSDDGIVSDRPYPDGESTQEVCDRVLRALLDVIAEHEYDSTIAIVSHMMPLTCVKSIVEGTNLASTDADLRNCEALVLDVDAEGIQFVERFASVDDVQY